MWESNPTNRDSRFGPTDLKPAQITRPDVSEDKDRKVVDRYGSYNPNEVKPGIPFQITYVINKDGVITHRFLDQEHFTRPTNEQVREELKKIGAVK